MEIYNAKIKDTYLGYEDHNILTTYITIESNRGTISFGGYSLERTLKEEERVVGTAYGMEFVRRIIKTVGVRSWEDLIGKHIRVKQNGGPILAIGNIMEDVWFEPKTDTVLESLSDK